MTDAELKLKCFEAARSNSCNPMADAKELFDWVKESSPKKDDGLDKAIKEEMERLNHKQ